MVRTNVLLTKAAQVIVSVAAGGGVLSQVLADAGAAQGRPEMVLIPAGT